MRKFWAPVPRLLEATIFIQISLGEVVESSVIGVPPIHPRLLAGVALLAAVYFFALDWLKV